MSLKRCQHVSEAGYGCWLTEGHAGDHEPDGTKLAAVSGYGPRCRHCGQPLTAWPTGTWADTANLVVCEVRSGRYRGHEPWHCDWRGGQCWCGDIHTSYAAVKLNGGTDRDARMPR